MNWHDLKYCTVSNYCHIVFSCWIRGSLRSHQGVCCSQCQSDEIIAVVKLILNTEIICTSIPKQFLFSMTFVHSFACRCICILVKAFLCDLDVKVDDKFVSILTKMDHCYLRLNALPSILGWNRTSILLYFCS